MQSLDMRRGKNALHRFTLMVFGYLLVTAGSLWGGGEPSFFDQARGNGLLFQEGFERCQRYVDGWLKYTDKQGPIHTKLLFQNPSKKTWTPHNAAADNYAFMVLSTSFTNPTQLNGIMTEILINEQQYASIEAMPVEYDTVTDRMKGGVSTFGASEYVKDGLMPLVEWMGVTNPWYDRLVQIQDEMWTRYATKASAFSRPIISFDEEVNGEQLQVLPRMYWITGDDRYLDWATRLGDHYLLGGHHPTDNATRLYLQDHGGEIVSGLTELYATVTFVDPVKAAQYRDPIHRMLDRILEIARNKHGLFYKEVNPLTGAVRSSTLTDNFGYLLNGYYTVYLLDGTEAYRDALLLCLKNLNPHYLNNSFGQAMDGEADAGEGAIYMVHREPWAEAEAWIDGIMRKMWSRQRSDGVISGNYPDGNFARTTIMYCLWKSLGTTILPYSPDVKVGAVRDNGKLYLHASADAFWRGRLVFDKPRHDQVMHMPMDWPRINHYPEWFTAHRDTDYVVHDLNLDTVAVYSGAALQQGVDVQLVPGQAYCFEIYSVHENAWGPQPQHQDQGVYLTEKLQWNTGLAADQVNPQIKKHLLYLSGPNPIPSDPFQGISAIEIEAGDTVFSRAHYQPVRWELDSTYYWRIDEELEDGTVIPGDTWTFHTITSGLPQITQQPEDVYAELGGSASFTVLADTPVPGDMYWQWYRGLRGFTGNPVENAVAESLHFASVQSTDYGPYWCRIRNAYGSVDSQTVTLVQQSMIAHWPLDTFQGVSGAVDVTGNGYDGRYVGSTNIVTGKVDQAQQFNSGSYINIPQVITTAPDSFTITAWVKTTHGPDRTVFGLASTDSSLRMQIYNGVLRYRDWSRAGASSDIRGKTKVGDGRWHFVAVRYDRKAVELYVDGLFETSGRASTVIEPFDAFQLANFPYQTWYLGGSLDDVRLYGYPLSADKITELFDGHEGGL